MYPVAANRDRRLAGRSLMAAACIGLVLGACSDREARPRVVGEKRPLMGTYFEIQVATTDEARAADAIAAAFDELARLEALLSEWRETSEISEVNRRAGAGPVAVGPELLEVVRRSIETSRMTDGAFDITFAACGGLWSFSRPRIPSDEELAACLEEVGYDGVRVDEGASSIELASPGMRIGIAGIGKGYAVDRAAAVLERRGFGDYFVDGGGDIRVGGSNAGRPWRVGIADPRRPGELLGVVAPGDAAIVSSGDYQIYFERDGRRYHHILDPRTGRPARGAIAVSVIAPDATEADALATGLFVLGPSAGLALAGQQEGVEALIVAPDGTLQRTGGFPPWR